MALLGRAIPSSVRVPGLDPRLVRSAVPGTPKPFLLPSQLIAPLRPKSVGRVDGLAGSSMTARALRLPQEPEDAKLTGATRSLDRRLLGLNLGGSLMRSAS